MDRDFAVERAVKLFETLFQKYGAEVLKELEEREELHKYNKEGE